MGRTDEVSADPAAHTLDALLRGRVRLWQPRVGARVTQDAVLLADFARRTAKRGRLGRVVDLGCGTGAVALMLAAADPSARVIGVELQAELAALARRNAAENDAADRVEIVLGDLAAPRTLPLSPGRFDLALANPPWFDPRGRRAPRAERALARHQVALTIEQVAEAARRLLAPRGRLAVVYPAAQLPALLAALATAGLAPRTMRLVHAIEGEPAARVLLDAARGHNGGLSIEPPLVLHGADRPKFTAEAAAILDGQGWPGG